MRMIERVTVCAVGSLLAGCVALGDDGIDDDGFGDSDDDGGGVVEPPPGSPSGLRVFATHGKYTGDLTAYLGMSVNGLAAGDEICQLRADSAELGGKFRAWLSSSQIDAIDRISGDGPWLLVGGPVAFANRAQLQTEPSVPLNTDEHGELIVEYSSIGHVWTGTRAGGVHATSTCADWTSTLARGVYGHSAQGSFAWTDYLIDDCTYEKHLVCLEQDLP